MYNEAPFMSLSINSTVAAYPKWPYEKMATAILGAKYDLSLSFIGTTRAHTLNVTYRKKTYIPNVLSFPLTDSVGEIYICPKIAKREAKNFNLSVEGYIAYLFIHGLVHLKGHDHGDTMDKLEQKFLRQFKIS